MNLQELAEMESEDAELIPDIMPVDARLSVKGKVAALVTLFERAVAVVPVKPVIYNTAYVLVDAVAGTTKHVSYVRVAATDGEQSISVVDDSVTINMAGAALVPGKRFLEILKLAPEETVRIDIFGNTATIRSGPAVWTVQTPAGDALPALPDVSAIQLHPVQKRSFLAALETARKAVATSTARSSLMQASIEKGRITACDAARVHRQTVEDFPKAVTTTLPLKLMDEAIRALRLFEDEIFHMGTNHHVIVFHFGQDTLIGQRLVVDFPDIEPLLLAPAMMNQQTLTVNRQDLLDSIRRVRVNADPDYFSIFLSLTPQKQESGVKWFLGVRAHDRVGNTAQEVLEATYEGGSKAREICVNHKYLSDLLSCFTASEVTFKLGEDLRTKPAPLLVTEDGFTGIVTPMTPQTGVRSPS